MYKNRERIALESGKDAAAKKVEDLHFAFEMALSEKTEVSGQRVRRYVELTKDDAKVHKSVVKALNGLREFIQLERRRIPGDIAFQADRLECLLFGGYDPSFEGNEPPGL